MSQMCLTFGLDFATTQLKHSLSGLREAVNCHLLKTGNYILMETLLIIVSKYMLAVGILFSVGTPGL